MEALHGLSGSYNTGNLAEYGKHSFRNAFQAEIDSTLTALASIGTTIEVSDSTFAAVESHLRGLLPENPHHKDE